MLEFSKIATLEKNKLSTDAPFLILIEVKCDLLDEPLYLARNIEDIVWNGHTWTAYPIDVEPHEEDGKTVPSMNLKISAGGGLLISYLQQYKGFADALVNLYVVNAKLLDTPVPEMELDFQITATSYDESWITFTLGPSPELANRFPAWKYLTDFCPFVCGDVRCGYCGEGTCRNNLESCLIPSRFGGEPGIQSGG